MANLHRLGVAVVIAIVAILCGSTQMAQLTFFTSSFEGRYVKGECRCARRSGEDKREHMLTKEHYCPGTTNTSTSGTTAPPASLFNCFVVIQCMGVHQAGSERGAARGRRPLNSVCSLCCGTCLIGGDSDVTADHELAYKDAVRTDLATCIHTLTRNRPVGRGRTPSSQPAQRLRQHSEVVQRANGGPFQG